MTHVRDPITLQTATATEITTAAPETTMAQVVVNGSASQKVLTLDSMNQNVRRVEYAVRGPMVLRAMQIEQELKKVLLLLFYLFIFLLLLLLFYLFVLLLLLLLFYFFCSCYSK